MAWEHDLRDNRGKATHGRASLLAKPAASAAALNRDADDGDGAALPPETQPKARRREVNRQYWLKRKASAPAGRPAAKNLGVRRPVAAPAEASASPKPAEEGSE